VVHAHAVAPGLPAPFLTVAPPTCRSRTEHPYRDLSDLPRFRPWVTGTDSRTGEMQDCQGTTLVFAGWHVWHIAARWGSHQAPFQRTYGWVWCSSSPA